MSVTHLIETAFSGAVHVRPLPTGGLAVGTDFLLSDGDKVGFYVQQQGNRFRIVDDGTTVPMLEAQGISFDTETREGALKALLAEHGFAYDEDELQLYTPWLDARTLPEAAKDFVSLRLRLQDFLLLHPEIIANTFKDDVRHAIAETFKGGGQVAFDAIVSDKLPDITVDALIRQDGAVPVAVFFGTSDKRILEAQILRLEARHQARLNLKVVSILENERPSCITAQGIKRAMNRLDRVLAYRGEESMVMDELRALAAAP